MTTTRDPSDKKDETPIWSQQTVTIGHLHNHQVRPFWTRNYHRGSNLASLQISQSLVAAVAPTVIVFGSFSEKETHLEFIDLQEGAAKKLVFAYGGRRTLISCDATQFLMVCSHGIEFYSWQQGETLKLNTETTLSFPKELALTGKVKLSSDRKYLLLNAIGKVAILNLATKIFRVVTLKRDVSDFDILDSHRLVYCSSFWTSGGIWEYDLTTQTECQLFGTAEQPEQVNQFYVFQNRWLLENGSYELISFKRENNRLVDALKLADLTRAYGRDSVRKDHVLIYQEQQPTKQPGDFFLYDDEMQRTIPLRNIKGMNPQQVYLIGFTPHNQLAFLCGNKSLESKIILCDLERVASPSPDNKTTEDLLAIFKKINQGIPRGVASVMASYLTPRIQLSDSKLECDQGIKNYIFRG